VRSQRCSILLNITLTLFPLQSAEAARIGDVQSWALKHKSIKHLNNSGEVGPSRKETKIEGYYVPWYHTPLARPGMRAGSYCTLSQPPGQ
jgi:hypothetical protein